MWYISHLILDINLWFNIVKLCVSSYPEHVDTCIEYTVMQICRNKTGKLLIA